MTTTKKDQEYAELFTKAREAGLAAGEACRPAPMIVGSPSTPLGNDIDYTKETYFVSEGCCGFAWVHIPDGRSAFARFLRKQEEAYKAQHGRGMGIHKGYPGGTDIWIRSFGQSLDRKEACARAAAEVLREAGIDCYAQSRMD